MKKFLTFYAEVNKLTDQFGYYTEILCAKTSIHLWIYPDFHKYAPDCIIKIMYKEKEFSVTYKQEDGPYHVSDKVKTVIDQIENGLILYTLRP